VRMILFVTTMFMGGFEVVIFVTTLLGNLSNSLRSERENSC